MGVYAPQKAHRAPKPAIQSTLSHEGVSPRPSLACRTFGVIMSAMLERLKGYLEPGSPEEKLAAELDAARLPRHVAVIMDGNGRWARERSLPRIEGHRAGSKSVREVVEACARLGIEVLTLFAFSRENWKRPKREVSTLWKLLEEYLKSEDKVLMENNFRLTTIGRLEEIPESTRRELARVVRRTASNSGLRIVLALNYGGRQEIVEAAKRWAERGDPSPRDLDEESFSGFLDTAGIPDPDLLIRTSGESRVSNFLLWQIAYSEIWITRVYWPEFRKAHLLQALVEFQKRERRFGALGPDQGRD